MLSKSIISYLKKGYKLSLIFKLDLEYSLFIVVVIITVQSCFVIAKNEINAEHLKRKNLFTVIASVKQTSTSIFNVCNACPK